MIYLLTGSNTTEKELFRRKITQKISKEDISVYFADEQDASYLFSTCYQDSLFGSQNVVNIRNISSIKESSRKKEFNKTLLHYIEKPNPDTLLILEMEALSASLKKAIQNNKNIHHKEFRKAWHKDLLAYVRNFFAERKIQIDPIVSEFLVEMCNNNQEELAMTCSLLVNYAGKERILHFEKLRTFLKRSHTLTVFDVIDALFEKEPEKGLHAIEDLKLQKEPILRLNALILRSAKLMWHYLTLHDKNNFASALGVKPFEAKRLSVYARFNTLKEVSGVLSLCRKIEWTVKTKSEDLAWLKLETFLLQHKGIVH